MQLRLPETPVIDVRVAAPWDELKNFCLSINLSELEEIKHKHMPYIILLIQALEKYGKNPSNTDEKNEFKALLKSMNIFQDEQNGFSFFFFKSVNVAYSTLL